MTMLINAKSAVKYTTLAVYGVLLTFGSLTAHAVNVRFMDNSLLTKLGKEEVAQLRQEIATVLDKSPDLEIIDWLSPASGIKVQIKPKLSFKEGTTDCRRTLFRLSKGDGKPEFYRFDICRDAEKKWRVKHSLASDLTAKDLDLLEGTLKEVLDSEDDNRLPASWFNPETKNAGVVVPTLYIQQGSTPCREVAISISNASGGTMDGSYTFCKKAGNWERQ